MNSRINTTRLVEAVRDFCKTSILVVGDLMLDRFVWGEVSRISPEAPVPVVQVNKETMLLGGAANVANNIRAMGAGCFLGGVIGNDEAGAALMKLAGAGGMNTKAVATDTRPTTVKTRILARGQQVVRVDREEKCRADKAVTTAIRKAFARSLPQSGCVVVSDYAKGVITTDLMNFLVDMTVEARIPLLVDPKPANMDMYRGVTLLTPNRLEAEAMSGVEISDDNTLSLAAGRIMTNLDARALLVTRGACGMGLIERDQDLFTIPTMAREVFDVTGAGDTVIATFAMGIANGLRMAEAAWLANVAAGLVVGKVGTATINADELVASLENTAQT